MPKNSISKVAWKPWENIHDSARTTSAEVMLMAEIRRSPVEVVILSYYLQGFIHPRWLHGMSETSTVPRLLGRCPVPQMTSRSHHLLRFGMTGGPQQTYHPNTNSTSGGMTGCLGVILKIRKKQRIKEWVHTTLPVSCRVKFSNSQTEQGLFDALLQHQVENTTSAPQNSGRPFMFKLSAPGSWESVGKMATRTRICHMSFKHGDC